MQERERITTRINRAYLWIRNGNLPPSQAAVLAYVAFRDGSERGCYASVATIASETGWSERTVKRSLKTLTIYGVISCQPRPGKTTIYRLRGDTHYGGDTG